MSLTILPSDAAGRDRSTLGAQYINSSLAPPLPACEREPAVDVGSGDGYWVPFPRTLVLSLLTSRPGRQFRRRDLEALRRAAEFKLSEKPRTRRQRVVLPAAKFDETAVTVKENGYVGSFHMKCRFHMKPLELSNPVGASVPRRFPTWYPASVPHSVVAILQAHRSGKSRTAFASSKLERKDRNPGFLAPNPEPLHGTSLSLMLLDFGPPPSSPISAITPRIWLWGPVLGSEGLRRRNHLTV